MRIHIVRRGETIYSIARLYGVSPARLLFDNQITLPCRLVVGQALLILLPDITHTVRAGESLSLIAREYGVPVLQLIRNNPYLLYNPLLPVGQQLVISYQGDKIGSLSVNGYAYPFISSALLEETLAYISDISIFSYGFTSQGDLIPTNDTQILEAARRFGVRSILVLTPITEQGTFNSELVQDISYDQEAQERLIQNLLYTVRVKGYSGVDVDFEFIPSNARNANASFVSDLTAAMNAQGYTVSMALPPKTSSQQRGLLYEGVDYSQIGEIVNSVLLMTYEWGYTYGPPMAVAPLNSVRQVLDYAVTQIPPEKIDMGIPNYGYDWLLPFERGVSRADTIGNVEAVEIAAANGAEIQYDEVAQSPYFSYTRMGRTHEVWFEDVRSIEQKLRTASEYQFRGVGYWNLMRPFRANWLLLNALFDIK